jgi:hypothetical protein
VASISGWIAAVLIVLAALVPLVARVRAGKRPPPTAPPIQIHVVAGLATSLAAFLHTGLVLPELGSPAAVAGGSPALFAGAVAFLVLVAHGGLGLRLRDVRLRDRSSRRRRHVITAVLLALTVAAHAWLLSRAANEPP